MKRLPDITTHPGVRGLIRQALAEDVGQGDITTIALVPPRAMINAVIVSRGGYVISGIDVARAVFREVDRSIQCHVCIGDGRHVGRAKTIMNICGRARAILTAERTALNFLQRMTGIATITDRFVQKVRHYDVIILDTRKTSPGLRIFEKYAVRCGGGYNHRMGLYDRFLVKDNHRRLWKGGNGNRLDEAIIQCRRTFRGIIVEVEVETEEEMKSALKSHPEWILLDNMSPTRMRKCVRVCRGRALLEASGGITLKNVKRVASTGVDAISLGCLTHSAPAADISLEVV